MKKKPRFKVGDKVWIPATVVHADVGPDLLGVGRNGLWLAYQPHELRRRK